MASKSFKNTPEMFISTAASEAAPKKNAGADPGKTDAPDIPKGYRLVKETKSERMHIMLRPSIKEGLKAKADAQGTSVNDLINSILEEYIDRKGE